MSISIIYLPINTTRIIPRCKLYLWAENGDAPVDEFLQELSKSRPNDFRRLIVLFERMSETGKIINVYHFKDVTGHKPLFEFKGNGIRVYCFYDGKDLILVEGDIKKSDKSKDQNRQSIARAERRYALYQQAKKMGSLGVEE